MSTKKDGDLAIPRGFGFAAAQAGGSLQHPVLPRTTRQAAGLHHHCGCQRESAQTVRLGPGLPGPGCANQVAQSAGRSGPNGLAACSRQGPMRRLPSSDGCTQEMQLVAQMRLGNRFFRANMTKSGRGQLQRPSPPRILIFSWMLSLLAGESRDWGCENPQSLFHFAAEGSSKQSTPHAKELPLGGGTFKETL